MPSRVPWLRVTAEGFVIVASILLALAADAWWQDRQDLAEEQELLRALAADFEANLSELDFTITTHESMVIHQGYLMQRSPSELDAVPDDSLYFYNIALAASGRTFQPTDGTLDAILSSGKLELIRDTRLRDRLVAWKSAVEDTREEADQFRVSLARVIERAAQLGGPWYADIPTPGGQGGGDERLRTFRREALQLSERLRLSTVVGDPELMARVREKRTWSLFYLLGLGQLSEVGDSIVSLIQANRS